MLLARLDAAVAVALNHWGAGASTAGPLLAWLVGADLVKTLPFLLLLVAAWHWAPLPRYRLVVVQGVLGALLAMVLGRLLPLVLPYRARPLRDAELGLLLPPGVAPAALDGWTSFPSDHGLLCGALVGAVFALHRRLGWLALGFAAVVVWLPRLVLGYHYATDIVAGALLGLGCAWLAQRPAARARAGQPLLALAARRPAGFHALAFLLLVQLAQLFGPLRTGLGLAWMALR